MGFAKPLISPLSSRDSHENPPYRVGVKIKHNGASIVAKRSKLLRAMPTTHVDATSSPAPPILIQHSVNAPEKAAGDSPSI